jgi:hypothetical protein
MSGKARAIAALGWRAGPRLVAILARLGIFAAGLRWHRRRALASFRQGLMDAGVPPEAATQLESAYPDFLAAFRGR